MAEQSGTYICGWCNTKVERKVVYESPPYWVPSKQQGMASGHAQHILTCVSCDRLSYDVATDDDVPQWPKLDTTMSFAVDVVPEEVGPVWTEVCACRQADAPMATAAMLRTLIIAIWLDQNKDKAKAPTFLVALNDLEKSDLLNRPLRDRTDKLRVLGNDAVHEIKPPTEADLEAAMKTAHLWLRIMYEDVPQD
jgi:hypothetical protein